MIPPKAFWRNVKRELMHPIALTLDSDDAVERQDGKKFCRWDFPTALEIKEDSCIILEGYSFIVGGSLTSGLIRFRLEGPPATEGYSSSRRGPNDCLYVTNLTTGTIQSFARGIADAGSLYGVVVPAGTRINSLAIVVDELTRTDGGSTSFDRMIYRLLIDPI